MPSSGMLRRVALVRTDVSDEQRALVASYGKCPKFTDSCHLDDGGAKFLRNFGSYKSHMA
jgi:hypothetical protein